MCAPIPVWVWRPEHNPWELLVPSLPGNWTQAIRLSCKDYSSSWAILLAPIFILLFSNLIYHVDMVAHTTISASWEAEAGGRFWVKGFEAGLGSNIARLSWNKKSRPQISGLFAWNATVHCPNVVFVLHYLQSLLLWSSQANASQCAWTFAMRDFVLFCF